MKPSQIAELKDKLTRAMEGATPSLQISAFLKGRKQFEFKLGDSYTYFDWASLTKVVFSTSFLMTMVDQDRILVEDPVHRVLGWFPYKDVCLRDLLTHSAGFRWWSPYYKTFDDKQSSRDRWQQLQILLREEERQQPVKEAVYSDIDMLLIGHYMEHLVERPLLSIWDELREQMGIGKVHFCVDNQPVFDRKLYAPTENCPWRKRVLQGEVHDENTSSWGGVSSHAGLFGRLVDLESWALGLRQCYLGSKKSWVRCETARLFLRHSVPKNIKGDWALGYMMPTEGNSSSGRYFSPQSVGHTGFTGTSFWFDPECDLMVLILSNRVNPTRDNKRFVQLRPQIHNWIREALNLT